MPATVHPARVAMIVVRHQVLARTGATRRVRVANLAATPAVVVIRQNVRATARQHATGVSGEEGASCSIHFGGGLRDTETLVKVEAGKHKPRDPHVEIGGSRPIRLQYVTQPC